MNDWGYTAGPSRQNVWLRPGGGLAEDLAGMDPSIYSCTGCGTCTATCSANSLTGFNPRRIIRAVLQDNPGMVRDEIGKCVLCGKCRESCPRDVNTRNIFLILKNRSL